MISSENYFWGFSENLFSTHYRYFSSEYSKLATNLHPLSALSILSQNKAEILDHRERLAELLQIYIDQYFKQEHTDNGLKVLIDAYHNSQPMPTPKELSIFQTSTLEVFGSLLSDYLATKYASEFYHKSLYERIEKYILEKERLEAIQAVISYVIKNDYPDTLNTEPTSQQKEERNIGRPLDPIAPQKLIAEVVKKLALKKDFQHPDGRPKPTTIRDYLLKHHSDIVNNLSERALFDRVKKALKNSNMQ